MQNIVQVSIVTQRLYHSVMTRPGEFVKSGLRRDQEPGIVQR